MRKRTCKNIADIVFWYALYFLPVLCYLLYMLAEPAAGTNIVDFGVFMNSIGLGVLTDNVVYTALSDIFGANGILPFFANANLIAFFSYFISVVIVHLFVDFLLFIPRLAHKWLGNFTNSEG